MVVVARGVDFIVDFIVGVVVVLVEYFIVVAMHCHCRSICSS